MYLGLHGKDHGKDLWAVIDIHIKTGYITWVTHGDTAECRKSLVKQDLAPVAQQDRAAAS